VIKIVLTGSESTGKTEMARQLADYFDAPLAEEFVRSYAAERGGKIEFADHGPIARGQMAAEDAAMARAKDVVILDSDLVSTVVYCEHYFGRCPAWIEDEARSRAGSLYLLMQPDIPWVPDGVRDREHRREEMHRSFKQKLESLGLRYVEMSGHGEARFTSAVRVVRQRMAEWQER
jgi:NadR type nicotinamide-nucleotide adenylyltransferase